MAQKKRKAVKKKTPKKSVKVEKAAFDAVLDKLIKSLPHKDAEQRLR